MARYPLSTGTLGGGALNNPLKISQFFFPIYATIKIFIFYLLYNKPIIIFFHTIRYYYYYFSLSPLFPFILLYFIILIPLLYLLYYIHSIILNTHYFYIVMKPIISYWMCIYFLISLFLVVWLIDFIVNIGYFRYIKFDRII